MYKIVIIFIFSILSLALISQYSHSEKKANEKKQHFYNNKIKILSPHREILIENDKYILYKMNQYHHEYENISRSMTTDYYFADQEKIIPLDFRFLEKYRKSTYSKKEVQVQSGESGECTCFNKRFFLPTRLASNQFLVMDCSFTYTAGVKQIKNDNFEEYAYVDELNYSFYIITVNLEENKTIYPQDLVTKITKDFYLPDLSNYTELDRILIQYGYALGKQKAFKIPRLIKEEHQSIDDCLNKGLINDIYPCINNNLTYGLRGYYIPELFIKYIKKHNK